MDRNQRIAMLSAIVGGDEDAATLSAYLDMAAQAILNKAYAYDMDNKPDDVPEKYQMRQIEIASFLMNKRGAEGEVQHIENGIHRNYQTASIPDDMLREVIPFVGVVK